MNDNDLYKCYDCGTRQPGREMFDEFGLPNIRILGEYSTPQEAHQVEVSLYTNTPAHLVHNEVGVLHG